MSVVTMRSTQMERTLEETLTSCPECAHLQPNSQPKFSTPVTVYQQDGNPKPRKFKMVAGIHESSSGHYVLLNQDKVYCGSPVFVNLKNSSVQRVEGNGNVLRIVSNNGDGMSLTFELPSEAVLEKWLEELAPSSCCQSGSKSPAIPRSPLLPTLTEDEDE